MNIYTTANFINEFDFDYFETYTIKRITDSETLKRIFGKLRDKETLTETELNIFKLIKETPDTFDDRERILQEDGTFHTASR